MKNDVMMWKNMKVGEWLNTEIFLETISMNMDIAILFFIFSELPIIEFNSEYT